MNGIALTPLRQIPVPGGAVYHGLRSNDPGFSGFGEAYFSWVDRGAIKGWKRHRRMVMNLIVPVGRVRFVIRNDVEASMDRYACFDLSQDPAEYARLTVQPGLWMAFTGLGEGMNLVLNLASTLHDIAETDRQDVDPREWRWS